MRNPDNINKKIEAEINAILLRNFDNDKYLWSVANKELIDLLLQVREDTLREVEAKTKGVRDALLVGFHNAVNDQKAPYRHAIQAIEEEILSQIQSLTTNKE